MNKHTRIIQASLLAAVVLGTSACSSMNQRDRNTAAGAAIGAGVGAILSGGSGIGTAGGAAVGGVIGNQVGR